MNKKRFMVMTTIMVVLVLSVAMLTACGGGEDVKPVVKVDFYPANFTAVDYSTMEEVAGKDAFDLVCEVYDNWVADKGYKRTQQFTFRANLVDEGGMLAGKQDAIDVYKIDGDKLYRRMVKIQGGSFADKLNEVTRFYYDGSKAMKVVENDKKNVPAAEDDFFAVLKEPTMKEYAGRKDATIEQDLKTYTSHMTTYTWRDKANLIDDGFKVYKAADNTLRFTITINCSDEMMQGAHHEAWKEFETSTGADTDSIKMRENTTIDFVVGEVDGKNKILAWRRTEKYKGAKAGMDLIVAKQCSVETFEYDKDAYTITAEDIA